jgi:hypothetical protein
VAGAETVADGSVADATATAGEWAVRLIAAPCKLKLPASPGRPWPSDRRFRRKIGSIRCHGASLSCQHPRMPCFCPLSSAPPIAE